MNDLRAAIEGKLWFVDGEDGLILTGTDVLSQRIYIALDDSEFVTLYIMDMAVRVRRNELLVALSLSHTTVLAE